MPFVNVKIAGPVLATEQVAILHREVTGLMADVLGKKAALTAVLIEDVAVAGWQVAGRPVTCAAHIDAAVTAGTNSADEKARFIAQANQLLHRVLGDELPLATYVVVTEIAADAWGYDGQTQAHRQIAR